jgi:hypothetical protein
MSKDENKQQLAGPWRSIHAAVWLIGLAILFYTGNWWPGILVLIAISGVVEALIRRYAPGAIEQEQAAQLVAAPGEVPPSPDAAPVQPASREHRLELLPSICPGCGGPIRGHEVKWSGAQSADCPYCGVNLPMGGARG